MKSGEVSALALDQHKGRKGPAKKLSAERRSEIAKKAARPVERRPSHAEILLHNQPMPRKPIELPPAVARQFVDPIEGAI